MFSSTFNRLRSSRFAALCVSLLLLSCAWTNGYAQENTAVDDMLREAQTQMSKGRPREAESILRKAISDAPDRADLYFLRSRARDSSGKFDAALEDATRYIELEPDDYYGYLNRARIYLSIDKTDSALKDANKAIEVAPNESDAYYGRADIYSYMGRDAQARADEAKAEELDRQAQAR